VTGSGSHPERGAVQLRQGDGAVLGAADLVAEAGEELAAHADVIAG
jgi:hypothetical protein